MAQYDAVWISNFSKSYYFEVPITYTCSNEIQQWFILLLQHSCDEMLYFVILLFCLCESHDVYFLYAFSTLYVFNILSIKLAVVLYIDAMKCLESMEMFAFVLVSVIKNIVNNLMMKKPKPHILFWFSFRSSIHFQCVFSLCFYNHMELYIMFCKLCVVTFYKSQSAFCGNGKAN